MEQPVDNVRRWPESFAINDTERVVAEFAHDLESSVLVIAKNAELLRESRAELPSEQDEHLVRITTTAARMQRSLAGMRNYARSAVVLDLAQVPLDGVVEEVRETLAPLIDEREARVLAQNELPTVTADRRQLVQLIQNLVSNAVKFGPPRDGLVAITAMRMEGAWQIAVSDTGPGIDDQHRERIFEPFQRSRGSVRQPGSGLGLAICKRVAESHGGLLDLRTNALGGTTFVFTLPDAASGANR